MPNRYLLNLTFDQKAESAADGLFNDSTDDPVSKTWYTIPDSWPGSGVIVTPGEQVSAGLPSNFPNGWGTPVLDSSGLACGIGDGIFIRAAWRNWSGDPPTALLLVAAFGRTAPNLARIASPFVFGLTKFPQTLFDVDGEPNAGGCIMYLGVLTQNLAGGSGGAGTFTYSFIVAAHAMNDFVIRQYGHDPQIKVGGGGGPLP